MLILLEVERDRQEDFSPELSVEGKSVFGGEAGTFLGGSGGGAVTHIESTQH